MTEPVEQTCRRVYAETADIYGKIAPLMGDHALGYKILYGPPRVEAPILILGLQPGGKELDAKVGEAEGERLGWPEKIEYAHKSWVLARKMRAFWDADFLDLCVGFNANFFRAPSGEAWEALPQSVATRATTFCDGKVHELINLLRPKRVVVIGLGNFDRLTNGRPKKVVLRSDKRDLVRSAKLFGLPAYGTVHLSGSRILLDDMATMRGYFASLRIS